MNRYNQCTDQDLENWTMSTLSPPGLSYLLHVVCCVPVHLWLLYSYTWYMRIIGSLPETPKSTNARQRFVTLVVLAPWHDRFIETSSCATLPISVHADVSCTYWLLFYYCNGSLWCNLSLSFLVAFAVLLRTWSARQITCPWWNVLKRIHSKITVHWGPSVQQICLYTLPPLLERMCCQVDAIPG